jgi:hypothetical protein
MRYTVMMTRASEAKANRYAIECTSYVQAGIFTLFKRIPNFSECGLESHGKMYRELSLSTPRLVVSLQYAKRSIATLLSHIKKNTNTYKYVVSLSDTIEEIRLILKGFKTNGREFCNDPAIAEEFVLKSRTVLMYIEDRHKQRLQQDIAQSFKKSAEREKLQIEQAYRVLFDSLYILLQYRMTYSELAPKVLKSQRNSTAAILKSIQSILTIIDSKNINPQKKEIRLGIDKAVDEIKRQLLTEHAIDTEQIESLIHPVEREAMAITGMDNIRVDLAATTKPKRKKLLGIF